VHAPGETYWSAWSDISRGPHERPLLAWGDLGVGRTFRDIGCVAFPTDSGWTPGEEIPGSEGLFTTPMVTQDRNGDAWLVWDLLRQDLTRFTHTYVSATASPPTIIGAGRRRVVHWTLSEPAPESWWAVLRARGRGGFEEVARVRAGWERDLSWADDSPPGGHLRYKIRRESVDTAYLWESEEAHWPPAHEDQRLRLAVPGPIRRQVGGASAVALELAGAAAGPLDVALYDLQGRLVLRQRPEWGGTDQDAIRIDLGLAERPLTPGIYFIRVQDTAGRSSAPLKIVILK
ncbi:MAG: T9SS type A sorting domain-containing protein, partial [Candidatus Eiseniibacteriota bacterium]